MVTGAARGIGYAYCRRLAADGANVVAVDVDDPAGAVGELTGGGDRLGLVCDVSEPSQVDAVAGTVLDRYGRCDILVNNAGIFPFADLDHMTIDLWRKVQAVNVEAILLFARAFAPGMRAAGWGRIVNTGSGITTTQNRDLAYMTSKGSSRPSQAPAAWAAAFAARGRASAIRVSASSSWAADRNHASYADGGR